MSPDFLRSVSQFFSSFPLSLSLSLPVTACERGGGGGEGTRQEGEIQPSMDAVCATLPAPADPPLLRGKEKGGREIYFRSSRGKVDLLILPPPFRSARFLPPFPPSTRDLFLPVCVLILRMYRMCNSTTN